MLLIMNNKYGKFLKIIKIIFSNPKVLGNLLQYDRSNTNHLKTKYKIDHLPTIDLLDLFPEFNIKVPFYAGLGGGSTPLDYALLMKLAKEIPCKRYFEIGTWIGESASNLSTIVNECVSLSLSDEQLQEKKFYTKEMIQSQRFYSKNIKNITHIYGDSKTIDYTKFGKFELIFIDGNHSYDYVKSDTMHAFKLLNNNNSMIVWHDYSNLTGDDINWEVFAGILDGCPKDQIQNLYHVSNTMCAIYTKKKISIKNNTFYPPTMNSCVNKN